MVHIQWAGRVIDEHVWSGECQSGAKDRMNGGEELVNPLSVVITCESRKIGICCILAIVFNFMYIEQGFLIALLYKSKWIEYKVFMWQQFWNQESLFYY